MTTPIEQEEIVRQKKVQLLNLRSSSRQKRHQRARSPRGRTMRGRAPRGGGRGGQPRERGEFEQVTIDARRVARVMAGGRRFNFSLVVVIGDKKGRVGVGLGKGVDTALAIDKAVRDAKKHLITVPRTASGSIAHQVISEVRVLNR